MATSGFGMGHCLAEQWQTGNLFEYSYYSCNKLFFLVLVVSVIVGGLGRIVKSVSFKLLYFRRAWKIILTMICSF